MKEKRKHRGGGVVLLIVVLLLALLGAAPFLYNALSRFSYDDYETLAAQNADPVDVVAAEDGVHLLLRADKADIYALLLASGAREKLDAGLDGRAQVERLGYSLTPDRLSVSAALKVFGFLPVQLRANARVSLSKEALFCQPSDVEIGPWFRLGAEKLADFAGLSPEDVDGFEIPLTDYTGPLRADRVWIEDDGICLVSDLPGQVLDEVAAQGSPLPELLRLHCGADAPAAVPALLGEGRDGYLRNSCASLSAAQIALRDLTAFADDGYRAALREALSGLPVDFGAELDTAPAEREKALEKLAAARDRLSDAHTALRALYWHREVTLTAARLLDETGAPLEERLPADWGGRIVLMYNANYDAIVKTNEGNPRLQVPIPGLPMMSELKRDSAASLPPEGDGPFDLTLAMRLPSGDCAIVFLTPEDEFGLCRIPEAVYAELFTAERLPVRAANTLIAPRESWLRVTDPRDADAPAWNYSQSKE